MTVRFLLATCLLAAAAADLFAVPKLTPPLDANGDPLPERAIVRFGSARFRHPGPLIAVAYSPDGKLVAASSGDPAVVRVWERGTGVLRDAWAFADPAPPEQLVFSRDSRKLVAGRFAGRSCPWMGRDLGKRVAVDLGPKGDEAPSFQTLTADGRFGVVVSGERVLVWDLAIDKQIGSFERPDRTVADCGGPELGWVMVTHNRTHYVATRLTDGKELWSIEGAWDGVLPAQSVALSNDGRRVALRTVAGRIDIHETATGKQTAEVINPVYPGILAMRFGPDGRSLAVSWKNHTTCLYDLPTGKERARLPASCGTPRDLAFAPDSAAVATVDPDGPRTLLFFEAAGGKPVDFVPGPTSPVTALAFAPDGSALACATAVGGEPALAVWDVGTGRPRWANTAGRFADLAFSPDGKLLASASRGLGNKVRLWDARSGRLERTLDTDGDPALTVAFARDGRLVAGTSTRIRAWDVQTGKPAGGDSQLAHAIDRVLVDPTGKRAVAATPDVYVCPLGEAHTGKPDIPIQKTLTGFALSPDGRLLATADGTSTVRFWEVLSKAEAATLSFADPVAGLAFAPDGRTLAAATGGGVVLFDLATAGPRFTLPRGSTVDTLVAFSADGRRLATAGNRECTATVWDVADLHDRPAGKRLTAGQLDECWVALADGDPKVGYAAAWKLAAAGDAALPFLTRRLGPAGPGANRIARLIADLDSPRFAVREQASKDLENIGEFVVERLRDARKGKVSAEQAERIDALLTRLAGGRPSSDCLRASRAVAALELIGGDRVRTVLADLATGPDSSPKTHEAAATLQRWK